MDGLHHVLVVESTVNCAEELRRYNFRVLSFSDTEAAFHAATSVDAVVVHLDASDNADPAFTLS